MPNLRSEPFDRQAIHKLLITPHLFLSAGLVEVFIENFAPDEMEIHLIQRIRDSDQLLFTPFQVRTLRAFTKWPGVAEGKMICDRHFRPSVIVACLLI